MKAPAIVKEFTGAGGCAAFTTSGPIAGPVRKIPKKKKEQVAAGLTPASLTKYVKEAAGGATDQD
jgi:hypothetical protein